MPSLGSLTDHTLILGNPTFSQQQLSHSNKSSEKHNSEAIRLSHSITAL